MIIIFTQLFIDPKRIVIAKIQLKFPFADIFIM